MRMFLVTTSMYLLLAAGCLPHKPRPTKTEPVGGVISQIHNKVNETVSAIELKDLHLFIANQEITEGRMPTKEEILAYAKKENKKLSLLLENGTITLTGSNRRESVWAYERDAPERGGWVITNTGETKMSAEELKKALGK